MKRLKVEKQFEETKERLEKEKMKLIKQVTSLTGTASESGSELERVKASNDSL